MPEPSQDFLDPSFLLPNVGAPFVIGLAVGYCAKKMLRAALLLGGMIVILFFVTEYYGIAVVNHHEIERAAQSAMDLAKQSGGFLMDRLSRFTCQGVSAGAGFLAGLRMG
ncbi:FUN14 domain-containing protein [uncultured Desulfobulbus sp.]|uniref:FUN14 domain-containing protein n=1 Tax=uncultured Desulfobulbus sp. TaxID=239745 RepID=UPI0029C81AA2|nr:FUN14 domain-containing protein [uncultured Desulfobulbus sp.]